MGLRVTAVSMNYDTFLKNAKAIDDSVYSVNEIQTFPFRAFFLNPPKADTLVRLVIEMEGESIGLEIAKTKYSTLKSLLTGKTETVTPVVKSQKPKTTTTPVKKETVSSTGSTQTGSIKNTAPIQKTASGKTNP